jgi:hypothetical protein
MIAPSRNYRLAESADAPDRVEKVIFYHKVAADCQALIECH